MKVEKHKLNPIDFSLMNDILINDKSYVKWIREVMNDDRNHQNNVNEMS